MYSTGIMVTNTQLYISRSLSQGKQHDNVDGNGCEFCRGNSWGWGWVMRPVSRAEASQTGTWSLKQEAPWEQRSALKELTVSFQQSSICDQYLMSHLWILSQDFLFFIYFFKSWVSTNDKFNKWCCLDCCRPHFADGCMEIPAGRVWGPSCHLN